MSEERLQAIEQALSDLRGRNETRFDGLDKRLDQHDRRFDRLEHRLDELRDTDLAEVRGRLGEFPHEPVPTRAEMQVGFAEMGHQMRVLHEEVMDRLKVLPEASTPTRSEIRDAQTDLREEIGRKIDPLTTLA